MRDENCIFCKIAAGEIPSATLYEDDDFRVILDLGPASKGHALILPKEHYRNLYDIDDETLAKAALLAKKMVKKLTEYRGLYKPQVWLFERKPGEQFTWSIVSKRLKAAAREAGITKRIYPHLLCHSFATHLIEQGTDLKIVKELKELGYEGVVTSRSESKRADNDKIDIVDTNNELPVSLQIKKTIATPNYFKIRSESSASNDKFVVIWAKQETREKNMCTVGEMVMMDKRMFYELLRIYKDGTIKNDRDSGNGRQRRQGTDQ